MHQSPPPFFPAVRNPNKPRTIEVLKYRESRRPVTVEMVRTWCEESPPEELMEMVVHSRQFLSAAEFYQLLGEQWSSANRLWSAADGLRFHFRNAHMRTVAQVMTPAERKFLASLPEEFPVYRGCHHRNALGLAWSLDRNIASWFPRARQFQQEAPAILVEAVVRRDQCFVKLERNMLEVVAWQPTARIAELLPRSSN